MVGYFPAPFHDESLYSLVGRFHIQTLNSSISKTKEQLFGSSSINISPVYSVYINELTKRIDHISNKDSDLIINELTLWPYYFSFVDETIENKLRIKIKTGYGITSGSFARFGPNYSAKIKYCPICISTLKKDNRTLYWNRRHQIPNLEICIIHNCYLEEATPPYSAKNFVEPLIYPHKIFLSDREPRKNDSHLLLEISKHLDNILISKERINLNFNERIRLLNISGNSKNPFSIIKSRFENFYRDIPNNSGFYSIIPSFITRTKWIANPYFYALFDFFLLNQKIETENVSKYFDQKSFGEGPWICLNPKCVKHNQKVVTSVKFKYYTTSKRTVGFFTCDSCNSNYTRSHFVKNGENIIFIKKNVQATHSSSMKNRTKSTIKEQRKLFWELRLNFKSRNQQRHRDRISANQVWLKKHDPKWLSKQTIKLKSVVAKRTKQFRDARETDYLNKVKIGYIKLKQSSPIFQITKSSILKISGFSWLSGYSKIDKFLKSHTETLYEFRVRRMRDTANEIAAKGSELTTNKLLKHLHSRDRPLFLKEANLIIKMITKLK